MLTAPCHLTVPLPFAIRCRHHTQPNESGATRVSFDLRCIPASAWPAGEAPPEKIGDYACAWMDGAGMAKGSEKHGTARDAGAWAGGGADAQRDDALEPL